MRADRAEVAWLSAAFAAGAALRLHDLPAQVLIDDEWHAMHAAVRFGYGHLATQFGWTDRCIPFAIYCRLLMHTIGFSELAVRLPALLAGLATLVVVPVLLRRPAGRDAAIVAAWLLALSPAHVFFSRFARPYSVSLLLVLVATIALVRWWQGGRRRDAGLFVAAAVLAPWFHLTALPMVLLPLGVVAADTGLARFRRRVPSRSPREVVTLGAAVGGGLVLLLGLPLAYDHAALSYKAGRGRPDLPMLTGAIEFLLGTASRPVWAALGALALVGLDSLRRRAPRLALVLCLQCAAAPALVLASMPQLVEIPMIFARYCLVWLPVLAILVGCGLARVARRYGVPAGALLAVALLVAGPLPARMRGPNNFSLHLGWQHGTPREWSCRSELSPFYRALAASPPGSLRILEAPWYFASQDNQFACYQQVHRQHTSIGFVAGPGGAMSHGGLPRPGELPVLSRLAFDLRNFVHVSDHAEIRHRGFDWVVFHQRLAREMWHEPRRPPAEHRADVKPWIAHYASVYGPPDYEDDELTAFDVKRVTRRRSMAAPWVPPEVGEPGHVPLSDVEALRTAD